MCLNFVHRYYENFLVRSNSTSAEIRKHIKHYYQLYPTPEGARYILRVAPGIPQQGGPVTSEEIEHCSLKQSNSLCNMNSRFNRVYHRNHKCILILLEGVSEFYKKFTFISNFNLSSQLTTNSNPNINACIRQTSSKIQPYPLPRPCLQESLKANCEYLFLRIRIGFFAHSVKNNVMLTFQNKLLTVFHHVGLRHKAQECHLLNRNLKSSSGTLSP